MIKKKCTKNFNLILQVQWMVKSQINPQVWNWNMVWNIHACIGLLNKYFQLGNNQKLINWSAQIVGQWWSCTISPIWKVHQSFNPHICLHLLLTLVNNQFVAKCLPPFINLFFDSIGIKCWTILHDHFLSILTLTLC
jgi:hypothetical protein